MATYVNRFFKRSTNTGTVKVTAGRELTEEPAMVWKYLANVLIMRTQQHRYLGLLKLSLLGYSLKMIFREDF